MTTGDYSICLACKNVPNWMRDGPTDYELGTTRNVFYTKIADVLNILYNSAQPHSPYIDIFTISNENEIYKLKKYKQLTPYEAALAITWTQTRLAMDGHIRDMIKFYGMKECSEDYQLETIRYFSNACEWGNITRWFAHSLCHLIFVLHNKDRINEAYSICPTKELELEDTALFDKYKNFRIQYDNV